jgi:hypothetical protein
MSTGEKRMRVTWKRSLALALLSILFASNQLFSQPVVSGTEDLDFDRPESWALKYFASLSLLTSMGVPKALEPGTVQMGFEGGWVPGLSDDERRVGFNGTKLEDLNKTSFFGRIRGTIGLPGKLSITFGYVPPIELNGAKPHLFSAALGRPIFEPDWGRSGARVFGQFGTIEGDFTCSEQDVAGGEDSELNPFGCEAPSNDKTTVRYLGFELSQAFNLNNPRFEPYVAVSVNYLDLKFQVDALYSGIRDETLQLTDGFTVAVSGGIVVSLAERWSLVGEVFYSPLGVVRPPGTESQNDGLLNVRVMIQYRL